MARTAFHWFAAAIMAAALSLVPVMGYEAFARDIDIDALFAAAEKDGRVGIARKTKPVDARPAKPGEVVVSVIKGEGKETQSKPAEAGDMVVRNRCGESGNEEQLVKQEKFIERYEGPVRDAAQPEDAAQGWQPYRPLGKEMMVFTVRAEDGSFSFTAPWGEAMVAKPGDVIARDPKDVKDTYRIARAAFDCTYEMVQKAKKG